MAEPTEKDLTPGEIRLLELITEMFQIFAADVEGQFNQLKEQVAEIKEAVDDTYAELLVQEMTDAGDDTF